MKFLSNISINFKLILMQLVTFFVVIVFCAGSYLYVDYQTMLTYKSKNLLSIAQVLGTNSQAPILFNDNDAANEILNDLKVEKSILSAALIDSKNNVLGSYNRKGEMAYGFVNIPKDSVFTEYKHNLLFVYYNIKFDDEWLGTVCIVSELSDVKAQFYEKVKLAFLVIMIGFFVAIFLSSFLQKYISQPIINLANLMDNVIKSMNYKIRFKYSGKDEIAKLSTSFNKMLEQIENHERSLLETNNLLESRVEERTIELKQKNEKLHEANILAEQSRVVKEQFLATMSHEIRTPLNAIIGFQELLKDTPLTEEQKEYVESIDFAGKNLLVIINDILDLSKIEAGKFEFNKEELNVKQILKSSIELIDFKAQEKNLKVILEHDVNIPIVLVGDAARFNQIILNLIGNAVKFTEKGSVTITTKLISSNDKEVLCEFKIQDTGIGIPKDKLNSIFDRFTQASAETTRKYGGTGLGLTIVQQLLQLQGGRIEVMSELGKGSVFTFYLPFKQTSSKMFNNKKQTLPNADVVNLDYNKKLKILLAEDTLLNQRLVNKVLAKWGYELDIANNGKEALELLQKNDYDLVLMDIQMPEMDGYMATEAIREMDDYSKKTIPIIALTAHASQQEADKCLKIGMNAYVTKPFNSEYLRNMILQLTSKSNSYSKELNVHEIENKELFDLTYLREHAAGDNNFLKEMISEFLNETPNQLNDLEKDISSKDFKQIKVTSHSMKGLFLTLGMNRAAKLLKEIETNAETESYFDVIQNNFDEIKSIFSQSKVQLELELEKLK